MKSVDSIQEEAIEKKSLVKSLDGGQGEATEKNILSEVSGQWAGRS